MKRQSLLFIAAIILINISALYAQNPVVRDQFTADPTARVFGDRIYFFPSHDIPSPVEHLKEWFCMADYHVFSSENLTDWTDHGVIVSQETVPWVNPEGYQMWAPDCIERDGKYYFYFPAPVRDSIFGRGSMIGVAIAEKPYGPYIPQPEPIKGVFGIDPGLFIDTDGQAYLYWAGRGMQMAKLKDNMVELASEPVLVPGLPEGGGLKEGPFLFERNGKYYYTYPWVIDKTEALVYCMGDSPMGPFEYKGIIMDESPTGCWTNHHSILEFKDQWYLFYHHNDYSPEFDKNRSTRIDSLFFNPDGTIQKVIPTLRGVGISDAKRKIQLDRYSFLSEEGASIDFLNKDNKFEGWKTILDKKAWVQYNTVDFGTANLRNVNARVLSEAGGTLEVRTGGINGTIISDIKVPASKEWIIVHIPVAQNVEGIQNLFVTNKDGSPVAIDWLSFD